MRKPQNVKGVLSSIGQKTFSKDFNLVGESNKFEYATLDNFGITNDGHNLWVSDRYNDKIYELNLTQ